MIDTFIKKLSKTGVDCVLKDNVYYLVPPKLLKVNIGITPFHFGLIMGEVKHNKFMPSLALLDILVKDSNDKIVVKDIGEMDFLYGKNLRARHVKEVIGENKEGFMKLVVNENGECLGYGKILKKIGTEKGNVFKNLLDKGDYLRREK